MERDKFWDNSVPKELPYTIAALPFRRETDPFSLSGEHPKDDDVPVYMFNGNAMPRSTPLPGIRRYSSAFSVHTISNSILSSIKGVMMGRRTSDTYSEWSHEAGEEIYTSSKEELKNFYFQEIWGTTFITSLRK